jgi:predicted nucleotidyltransferase
MSDQIVKLKQKIVPVLQKNGVISSSIFGSYARGEEKSESDIDLLVELPKGSTLLDHVHLKLELEDLLGKKVDVVTVGAINSRLKPYINRDLINIL